MNIDHLVTFLQTLEPTHETHQFYWSGIHPDGRRIQTFGTLESMLPQLIERNNQGFGIFTSVNAIDNPSYEGGYARRRNADITRIRACFADWDTPNRPVGSLPLQPTMVVQTSEGKYHFYWCIDDGADLSQYEAIQKGIAQRLDTDPLFDLARELRIPGFDHTKDLTNRQPVQLIYSGGPRYTFAQLKEVFPYDPIIKKLKGNTWDGDVERKAAQTAAVIAANYLPRPDGGYNIRCPWASEHTAPDSVSCSTYWPPAERNGGRGSYVCKHAHCAGRMIDELDNWIAQRITTILG